MFPLQSIEKYVGFQNGNLCESDKKLIPDLFQSKKQISQISVFFKCERLTMVFYQSCAIKQAPIIRVGFLLFSTSYQ